MSVTWSLLKKYSSIPLSDHPSSVSWSRLFVQLLQNFFFQSGKLKKPYNWPTFSFKIHFIPRNQFKMIYPVIILKHKSNLARLWVKPFSIHWSPRCKQKVTAPVDSRADCTLVHGNPHRFSGPFQHHWWLWRADGYGQECSFGTGNWAFSAMSVQSFFSLIPKNILDIDIL